MILFATGGTGLIGSHIVRQAREAGYQVVASQYGPEPEWGLDVRLEPLDLRDHEAVRASIVRHRPQLVMHCAALLDQAFMYRHRSVAWNFMVSGTVALAQACREVGARLVFVSTDWVFDGREPLVNERSPPFPLNFYGIMKLAAEQQLLAMDGLDVAVGRLAAVYGVNAAIPRLTRWDQGVGLGDLPNAYLQDLRNDRPIEVWEGAINEAAHPTLASDAAELLLRLARRGHGGVYHTCGSESIDRWQLAECCAEVFGGDPERIRRVPVPTAIAATHADIRPPYRLVMSVEASAEALGRRGLDVRAGLERFQTELEEAQLP